MASDSIPFSLRPVHFPGTDSPPFPHEFPPHDFSSPFEPTNYSTWALFGAGKSETRPAKLSSTGHAGDRRLTAKIIIEVAVSMSRQVDGLFKDGFLPIATLQEMKGLYTVLRDWATTISPESHPWLAGQGKILAIEHDHVMACAMKQVRELLHRLTSGVFPSPASRSRLDQFDQLDHLADVLISQEDAAKAKLGILMDKTRLSDSAVFDALNVLVYGVSVDRQGCAMTERRRPRKTKMGDGMTGCWDCGTTGNCKDSCGSRDHASKLGRGLNEGRKHRRFLQHPEALKPGRPGYVRRARTEGPHAVHGSSKILAARPIGPLRTQSEMAEESGSPPRPRSNLNEKGEIRSIPDPRYKGLPQSLYGQKDVEIQVVALAHEFADMNNRMQYLLQAVTKLAASNPAVEFGVDSVTRKLSTTAVDGPLPKRGAEDMAAIISRKHSTAAETELLSDHQADAVEQYFHMQLPSNVDTEPFPAYDPEIAGDDVFEAARHDVRWAASPNVPDTERFPKYGYEAGEDSMLGNLFTNADARPPPGCDSVSADHQVSRRSSNVGGLKSFPRHKLRRTATMPIEHTYMDEHLLSKTPVCGTNQSSDHTLLWHPLYSKGGDRFRQIFDDRDPPRAKARREYNPLPQIFDDLDDLVDLMSRLATLQRNGKFAGYWPKVERNVFAKQAGAAADFEPLSQDCHKTAGENYLTPMTTIESQAWSENAEAVIIDLTPMMTMDSWAEGEKVKGVSLEVADGERAMPEWWTIFD
ncbi:uncharacterized protein LTR77_007966 [Saxophila tyrrhenica]|uniref:Uncharacterized protein n=1 Tax=Saxophila tyrrhenica TaxID=1690608 RepID=A0AAV9P4S8_9PEZI|nr:hypothetical protein LTR77_007966 [Saxophila tyrrhenica]